MSSRRIPILFSILMVFGLLLTTRPSPGQNYRGAITGVVTDPSQSAVPNAAVTAVNDGTAVSYSTVAASNGDFTFQDLPLGSYTVTVTAAGFSTAKIDKVTVSAGAVYSLPVPLKLASTATTIEVSAAALTLDTSTTTITTVIPQQAVQDIPNNGRDFTQFLQITPGFAGYSLGGGAGVASVNGARTNQVNWQVEGTDNNDLWWNIPAINQGGVSGIAGIVLPIDAVDQFSFVTASTPESGRNPGGTVNLVIKSGTNSLHGSLYYFNRNEFLAANTPFADGAPKNKTRNQNFGGSVGGPIFRDKTFFFVTYERQQFVIGNQTRSTEPSTAYQNDALSLMALYGISPNPVSQALLAGLYPASALTGPDTVGNYFNPGTENGHSNNGIIKLDQNFSDKDHLSVKWYIGQGTQVAPTTSYLTPYYEVAPIHVQNYSIIENHVFSPKITNQLFLGVNYFNQAFSDSDNSFDPAALGLDTGVTSPALAGAPKLVIAPAIAGSGLSGNTANFDITGATTESGRNDITGHLDDAVSYTTGGHQFRFGGEFRQAQVDDFYQSGQRGTFNFTGIQGPWLGKVGQTPCQNLATRNQGVDESANFSGNAIALADFLTGCVNTSTIVLGDPKRQVFENTFDLFVQDNWQFRPRLNINYGLRYDYTGPIHSQFNDLTSFDPLPSAENGIAVAGLTTDNLYQQYRKSFSPRAGFSFQPKENGNTVLRGAFGVYFDTPNMVPFLNLRGTTNGGPFGVEDNPAGANPVAAAEVDSYILAANQPIFPSLSQAIAPNTGNTINLFSIDPKFRPSYAYNYDLNVQQSIGPKIVAQIGYVGTSAHHLIDVADINQAAPNTSGGPIASSRPYYGQFPGYTYGVINQVQSRENSNYNSLQALIQTQSFHGLSSQMSYTWSHNLDQESGLIPYLPQDSLNLKAEYGNSDFDIRNTITGYLSYQVPGSSHLKLLSSGWQVNSLMSFHGGFPYTVVSDGTQSSGNGENSDRANPGPAGVYQGVNHSIVNGTVQWFNPDAFVDAPSGQYGTTRRGQNFGPGYADVDLSVFKNTPINERINTQLRIDMFNVFNRINLAPVGFPSTAVGGGSIGQTVGAYNGAPGIGPGEPYNTEVALKIIF